MALPASVKKQVDEANRIVKELEAGTHSSQTGAESDGGDLPKEGAVQQSPGSEKDGTDDASKGAAEGKTEPSVTLVPEGTPAEPKADVTLTPAVSPEGDDFEHKYRVLQGKYNAEIPRLSDRVAELEQLLATMAVAPANPTDARPQSTLVTQEEIDDYGEDLLDVIGRKAQEIAGAQVSALEDKIATLTEQLGGVSQRVVDSGRDKLLSLLAGKHPNWEAINGSREFVAWLDHRDPYSGQQRGLMLRRAFEESDAERVIAFFTGFLEEHAAVTAQGSDTPAPADGAVDLEDFVTPAPKRGGSAPTGAQEEERIWTQPEIKAFYADVRKGVFKNKPEEREEFERDLIAAAREGRIRT